MLRAAITGRFARRHRYLAGYVFLVAVAFLASTLHTRNVQKDLQQHDAVSCQARSVLLSNQEDVLKALVADLSSTHEENALARIYVPKLTGDLNQVSAVLAKAC